MDHTQNFNGLAADYTVGRPAYAMDFIDSLYVQYGFTEYSTIADIGAGTGKFSKQLLDRGSTVYGIEPNDDMRNTAIKELGKYHKFHAVNGTAADTKLAENRSILSLRHKPFTGLTLSFLRKNAKEYYMKTDWFF